MGKALNDSDYVQMLVGDNILPKGIALLLTTAILCFKKQL